MTVKHGSEIPYAYGQQYNSTTPVVQLLGTAMVDYWLSFITSQTPNDGKGVLSTLPQNLSPLFSCSSVPSRV